MASLTITNVSASDYWLNDIYATVPAGEAVVVTRSPAEISSMAGLQAAVADGVLTSSVEFSADELAADLSSVVAPASVGAVALNPVAATAVDAPLVTFRKAMTSGGASGTLDDVTIYAVNTLPYKVRILDAMALIGTAGPGSSVLSVRSAAAGGGTLAATIPSDATGVARMSGPNASVVLTPGASVGLFIRRDRSVVGEVVITARREV
jgi:hypothetical protein